MFRAAIHITSDDNKEVNSDVIATLATLLKWNSTDESPREVVNGEYIIVFHFPESYSNGDIPEGFAGGSWS